MNGREEMSGKPAFRNGKSCYKLSRLGVADVKSSRRSTNIGSSGGKDESREKSFLPIAIIFNILTFLPADVLRKVMKLVCRDWYNIINHPQFIEAHLRKSTTGLLVGNLITLSEKIVKSLSFVEIKEFTKLTSKNCRPKGKGLDQLAPPHLPRPNELILSMQCNKYVVDCCDGLILIEEQTSDREVPDVYHVVNPVSMQKLTLSPPAEIYARRFAAITRATSSIPGKYKVVLTSVSNTSPPNYRAFVSTINGDDKSWRCIYLGDGLVPTGISSVGGFIYWHLSGPKFASLALDVETEKVHNVDGPLDIFHRRIEHLYASYIKTERFLIMPVICLYLVWEFLALVDPKTGVWKKLFEVDLRDKLQLIEDFTGGSRFLEPRLVVPEKDLVVFSAYDSECFIGYRIKAKTLFKFGKIEPRSGVVQVFGHKKSLVPIKG